MSTTNTLIATGLGAGFMYWFDPDLGRRRRALLRDKVVSAQCQLTDALGVIGRDLSHRVQGTIAETRKLLAIEEGVPEAKLAARVRATLGRHVSHPRAIDVTIESGSRVVLRGPILAHEAQGLVRAIRGVHGVSEIDNRLELHTEPNEVPSLQGGRKRLGEPTAFGRAKWTPTARMAVGVLAAGLMGRCTDNPTPLNVALGTLGFGLFLKAATNMDMAQFWYNRGGDRTTEFRDVPCVTAESTAPAASPSATVPTA